MPRTLSEDEVADFRERLCDTAQRLFAEHGPDAVTMRQLASELGVSPMTPYRYFRDKDDILAAVRANGFDRFAAALESAYDSVEELSAKSAVVGEAYVRFAFENPQAYRLMFDLTQPNEADYPELVRATARARLTLTRHVEALIEAGVITGDPLLCAHILWASLHGSIVLQMTGKLDPTLDPNKFRQALMGAVGRGLALTPAKA